MTSSQELIPAVKIKTCRKCSAGFSGGYCKACKKISKAAWSAANPGKVAAYKAAWAADNQEKIAESRSAWRSANKDKSAESNAAWAAANPDKMAASRSAWRSANPEKSASSSASWVAANQERKSETNAAWKLANPEACRIHKQNRRAKKKDAGGKLSKGLAEKLFKLQRGKCACCGNPLGNNYHMDHITSLAKGGSNTDDNIQLLTQRCNNQKNTKDPIEFMQSRGFLI